MESMLRSDQQSYLQVPLRGTLCTAPVILNVNWEILMERIINRRRYAISLFDSPMESSKSHPAGAERAESQLRQLNAGFARWVATQIKENPSSDWSAAASEYTAFVHQIKSKWATERETEAKATKVQHK